MQYHMFIDESGTFNNESNRYYVISAILSNDVQGLTKLQQEIEVKIRHGQKIAVEMKASRISDENKAKFVQCLLAEHYPIYSVIMDKEALKAKDGVKLSEFSAYNYILCRLVKFVLADDVVRLDDDICLHVDNRSMADEFKDDLSSLLILDFYNQVRRISIEYIDSKISRPIQLADYVSNTIFGYYNEANKAYIHVPLFKKIKKYLIPEDLEDD